MPETLSLTAGTLSPADAAKAGAAGKGCKLVAFPTESSYAVGSTGLIKAATRRVLQVKERSTLKPLAVMVHSTEAAKAWVEWTPLAEALAAKFWPGPLLLLLKPTAQGRLLTFPEYPTVAIRVPAHPAARAMIEASGVPWIYTSANKSGKPAKLNASDVLAELGADIDLLIDGGIAPDGDPTLVDASGDKPRVTKVGLISAEAISGALTA
ncbi:MAG: L-threonylcarbamoyladenylate synthase [Elusimicrobia bacterium]|nr:L-threonylcarbamoyladenylate synthase [Elusimicrobiota bacterium]